jgi:RNA polymerase sigma-70 factor (ECF subfamily)
MSHSMSSEPAGAAVSPGQVAAARPGRALRLAGSAQLTERLVATHGPALSRFVIRLTNGDRARADDIYQETLLRAWRHPESCQRCIAEGPRWLYTIARRISIDQFRAAAARPELVGDDYRLHTAADPVDHVSRALLAGEVRAAVASLSPLFQEVLREIYMEDRPLAETALRLGIPMGTVKSRTYNALRALEIALAARGLDRSLALSA